MFDWEKYLSYIDVHCFRVALTQLRLNALPINNNLHRYSDLDTDWYCQFCSNCVEDERHVISVCPLYADLRNRFLQNDSTLPPKKLLEGSNHTLSLKLAKFAFHSMNRRTLCIHLTLFQKANLAHNNYGQSVCQSKHHVLVQRSCWHSCYCGYLS